MLSVIMIFLEKERGDVHEEIKKQDFIRRT